MYKFTIYTDGASRGNPGPGGFSAIIITDNKVKEIGGREGETTNNRMEMKAAIEGLKKLPPNSEVKIHTDSEYLLKGMTKWIFGWQKNKWKTKDKRAVLNQDLWEALLEQVAKINKKRKVGWQKVESHSGHELNDRADKIATGFADGKEVKLYNGPYDKYFFK